MPVHTNGPQQTALTILYQHDGHRISARKMLRTASLAEPHMATPLGCRRLAALAAEPMPIMPADLGAAHVEPSQRLVCPCLQAGLSF